MADAKGLLAVFGKPREGAEPPDDDGYGEDIPSDFKDHCDAAFDAIHRGKAEMFCEELWLAIKAYEEHPHEEGEEDDGEENTEGEEE